MGRLTSLPPRLSSSSSRLASTATATSGFARQDKLSATQRGYGADWRKTRAVVLALEPLCRLCAVDGRVTPATEVDHIQAFKGLADPLRLDVRNCRPLCAPCHRSRTGKQSHGRE